ncbi:MAG: T9SS type A sorting domain-containing protein [Candidatus Marinimicrobia bacterium]|nr:T9SS type A sorting domain-containing protein [Candidatus Neomarinimicrobiota bacterium]MCF7830318.1 T9SS type A sorting domain-containing protein [Candidatus Neomarinimicrobiota bacterium]MCF7882295.1 T9SS type A sorting domain-containing protein [Candidatus Neomarinimicrobiota bacterium]
MFVLQKNRLFLLLVALPCFLFSQVTWENIGPGGGSDLHFMEVHPENADIIYIGGDIMGIFKTTDGGESWTNINGNLAQSLYGGDVYWMNDIVLDPADPQTIYIATSVGLFRSTTGGGNWEMLYPDVIDNEDAPRSVGTVAMDSTKYRMFIGLGNAASGSWGDFEQTPNGADYWGVFRSVGAGDSWKELSVGLADGAHIHSIVIHPDDPNKVILSSTDGIYKSTNGGDTWSPSNTGLPHTDALQMIGRHYWEQYGLYLSIKTHGTPGDSTTFQGGLFMSTDFGDTWTDITGNLPTYDRWDNLFYNYWKFDVNPKNPEMIVTGMTQGSGYEDPGLYITWDLGNEWEYMASAHTMGGWLESDWHWDPYIFGIKYSPSDTSRLTSIGIQVDMSDDGGWTWGQKYAADVDGAWHGNGLELMNTETVAFDPSDPDVVYVGYDDMGLFRSDDAGYSYHRLDPHQDPDIGNLSDVDAVKDIRVDIENGDLYISRYQGSQGGYDEGFSSGGIVYSDDMGATQTDITGDLPNGRSDLVLDQQSGSPGNRTLYAAIYHHGVYKSTNSGGTWSAVNTGLGSDAELVWEIAIDPNNSDVLYLGLNHWGAEEKSLYKTTDGGANWSLVSDFPAGDVMAVYVDRTSTVYASNTDNFEWNYAGALARSADGGDTWEDILDHSRVIDVQLHPIYDNVLLAAGQQWYKYDNTGKGGALYLSDDNGTTWDVISHEVAHTFFNAARFNPHEPQEVYATTAGGGMWRSSNVPVSVMDETELPTGFTVSQNYPNPFNPVTYISFTVPVRTWVTIAAYNLRGAEIGRLVDSVMSPGEYTVPFDGSDLASGIYLYTIKAGGYQHTKRMLLIK